MHKNILHASVLHQMVVPMLRQYIFDISKYYIGILFQKERKNASY